MNKLWVFGDSFSAPFSKIMDTTGFGYRSKYNKWKGYISKSYGDIISDFIINDNMLKIKNI